MAPISATKLSSKPASETDWTRLERAGESSRGGRDKKAARRPRSHRLDPSRSRIGQPLSSSRSHRRIDREPMEPNGKPASFLRLFHFFPTSRVQRHFCAILSIMATLLSLSLGLFFVFRPTDWRNRIYGSPKFGHFFAPPSKVDQRGAKRSKKRSKKMESIACVIPTWNG